MKINDLRIDKIPKKAPNPLEAFSGKNNCH